MTDPAGTTGRLVITPLTGMPEVRPGDDLAALVLAALQRAGLDLRDGDVLVVSSKIVSKARGLALPSDASDASADVPRVRQDAIERESLRVVAERISPTGLTQVVETRAGPVMAAAGVDASNTGYADLLLLPRDPDAAAADLRDGLRRCRDGVPDATAARIGVVISDTAGRPWRQGQTDFALGASGVRLSEDLRGSVDAEGRTLQVTERCLADEVAAAADLVKGKTSGVPVAHVRGLLDGVDDAAPGAGSLVRTGPADWFGLGSAEAVRAALGVHPGTALARQAGIPFTGPEPVTTRVARAARVGTGGLADVQAEVGEDEVLLSAPDPFRAGYAAARLEVALAGEGLAATVTVAVPAARRTASAAPASAVGERGAALVTVKPRTAPSEAG